MKPLQNPIRTRCNPLHIFSFQNIPTQPYFAKKGFKVNTKSPWFDFLTRFNFKSMLLNKFGFKICFRFLFQLSAIREWFRAEKGANFLRLIELSDWNLWKLHTFNKPIDYLRHPSPLPPSHLTLFRSHLNRLLS